MDRTAWIATFTEELQRLRPHLQPEFGTSKLVAAIATQEYSMNATLEPKIAAGQYHARQVPAVSKK